MENNHCLNKALELISAGYAVIAVDSNNQTEHYKKPWIKWEDFQKVKKDGRSGRLPTETEVKQQFEAHPDANIAIIGGWNDIAVIDIDKPELVETLIEKFKDHAPLERTPRGGLHIFVREEEKSVSGELIGGIVDIKATGGYCITAPSKGYIKVNEITEPLPIPTSARDYATDILAGLGYEVINQQKNQKETTESHLLIPVHSRNEALTSIAGKLRHIGFDENEILAALLSVNESRCIDEQGNPAPLSVDEVKTIAKSIGGYPTESRGINEALHKNLWNELLLLDEYNLPHFPVNVLSSGIRDWVTAEAEATQTPVDLATMCALAVISASCQRKIEVQIKPGYLEPLSSYSVVALEPGNRKSSVFREATGPIYEYETMLAQNMRSDIAASISRHEIMEQTLKEAQKIAAKAKPEEKEFKIREAEDIAQTLDEMTILKAPRFVTDDATTEKLAQLLCDQEEKIAMLSADTDIFPIMAGRYSNKGEPNFGIYLKGHAGDPHVIDRMGRTGRLNRPALTLGLTIQLSVLRDMAKTTTFDERGLLARIWYSLPRSPLGYRKIETQAIPATVTAKYRSIITSLLSIKAQYDEQNKIIPFYLTFSSEALDVFQYYANEIEPKLGQFGELSSILNWASKLMGSIARLAGLLHMADHWDSPTPWAIPVSAITITRAITIAEYLTAHAKAAHNQMQADPVIESAKYVVGWLKKIDKSSFTENELFQLTKSKFKKIAVLRPVLNLLVEHGYLRKLDTPNNLPANEGPGRPKSQTYEVNPQILTKEENSQPLVNDYSKAIFEDFKDENHNDTGAEAAPSAQTEEEPQNSKDVMENVLDVFGDVITGVFDERGQQLPLESLSKQIANKPNPYREG